jgi:hypothetical protein
MRKNISFQEISSLCNAPYIRRTAIAIGVISALHQSNAIASEPAVWVTPVAGGEIQFYDWGYSGPDGRLANDFSSINGFNGATQIQKVVTTGPDGLTPDADGYFQQDLLYDVTGVEYNNVNMDSQVNFYNWGYTTVAGSTFSNMQIDADGDYLVKREDMSFAFYDTLEYKDQSVAGSTYQSIDTLLDFQPYALSDATGWCGSVTASNPGALEAMAGQVSFDFGFEAFFPWSPPGEVPGTGGMQIVKDFEMRSYGTLTIDTSTADGGTVDTLAGGYGYIADAVVNNTNPLDSTKTGNMITVPVLNMDGTAALDDLGNPRFMEVEEKTVGGGGVDEDYYNSVSFMGGGVVPISVWVRLADPDGPISNDNILEVLDGPVEGDSSVVEHFNNFAGYPFILRADGIRIIEAMDFSLYGDLSGVPLSALDEEGKLINLEGALVQDLSPVPVPAAVWLFGSGLLGLIGMSRKRKA